MTFNIGHDFQHTLGDPMDCPPDPTYWIPVVLGGYSLNGKYNWIKDAHEGIDWSVEDIKWLRSQPQGQGTAQCVGVSEVSGTFYANDIRCYIERCSVCTIPVVHQLYLRGPGPKDMTIDLDSNYYLFLEMQRNMSKLVFEGQNGLSQITWHPSEKKSSIKRYDNKEILKKKTRLEMNLDLEIGYTHPFGHFPELRWTFTNVRISQILAYIFSTLRRLDATCSDNKPFKSLDLSIPCAMYGFILFSSVTLILNTHVGMENVSP